MNIFICGGTGYLGSRVIFQLLQKGYHVYCMKRKSSDISVFKDKQVYFCGNDETEINKLFSEIKFDWVLNMACSYTNGDILYNHILEANLELPLKILNLAAKHKVRNFMTIGTGLPYNFNMYSFTKRKFGEFGEFYYEHHGINFINLELEMYYGPFEPRNRFLPSCIEKMCKNEDVPLTKGTQKRDIIYIDDVVSAIINLLKNKTITGFLTIPLGTGFAPQICEIISYLHKRLHSRSELLFGSIPMRQGEPDCIANTSVMENLGIHPDYSWKDGLEKMLKEEHKI